MTGEQFLNSLISLEGDITALDTQRVNLDGRRQSILDRAHPTAALSGVCVQTMPGSKTESLGIELAELPSPKELVDKLNGLQRRINRMIDLQIDRKQIALDIIEKMDTTKRRTLIIQRYLNGVKWSTIADLLHYNEHYVKIDLRCEAVAEFSALYEKNYLKLPIFDKAPVV